MCTVSLKAGLYTYNRFARGALDPPDREATQPNTGIVGVAGQAPALAAAGLVYELKAEREEKREHELDKRLGVTKELKVRRLILKIDGDSTVLACRLGCLSHLSPPLRWSLALMRHHGGNVLKYQEYCEKRRVLPLNPMESAKFDAVCTFLPPGAPFGAFWPARRADSLLICAPERPHLAGKSPFARLGPTR